MPRDLGTLFTGPGGASYLGQDGQQHQYLGQDASGNPIYDPNFPPATGSTGGTGGTGGNGQLAGANDGLVSELGPLAGNLEWGTTILACVGAVLAVALGAVAVSTAVFWLAGLLAVEIAFGFLGKALGQVENFFGGDPNEPGINPLTKFVRSIAQLLGLGGLLGDLAVAVAFGGAIYYFHRRKGKLGVSIRRQTRINPPRSIKKIKSKGRSQRRRP